MAPEAAWLLVIIVLRPRGEERHPSVRWPSLGDCYRKGLAVMAEELRDNGTIVGFRCPPA